MQLSTTAAQHLMLAAMGLDKRPQRPRQATKEDVRDPQYHAHNIQRMLSDVRDHARSDVERVDDIRARALFEVTAEVLQGLITSYEHYEAHTEKAWQ